MCSNKGSGFQSHLSLMVSFCCVLSEAKLDTFCKYVHVYQPFLTRISCGVSIILSRVVEIVRADGGDSAFPSSSAGTEQRRPTECVIKERYIPPHSV